MKIFALLLTIGLISSCSEEQTKLPIIDGTFDGTFKVTYGDNEITGDALVVLNNQTFTSQGNADRIPAGGSGSFTVVGNEIQFSDENYWTADFDWGLILNGNYTYSFDGEHLTMIRTNSVATYQYTLKLEEVK